MLTVYKFAVPIGDTVTINLPAGAKLLTVQAQRNVPQLWALVDPTRPLVARRFRFAGTGHPISEDPEQLAYVGTFQVAGGDLVFHLFEILFEMTTDPEV